MKVCVITGGGSGMGLEAARAIHPMWTDSNRATRE